MNHRDFFTPTEHAILCDYFEIERPPQFAEVDICKQPENDGIWVDADASGDNPLRNAVARIALGAIQTRLPQWAQVYPDGRVILGRESFGKPRRDVVLLPQHLFMINWADTAPGISWPEDYHVTYIPGYHRHVVTASWDTTDAHGVTEMAIGHFDGDLPLRDGSRNVIVGWWQDQAVGWDQAQWAYVWDEGLIDMSTAREWAAEVWGEECCETEEV